MKINIFCNFASSALKLYETIRRQYIFNSNIIFDNYEKDNPLSCSYVMLVSVNCAD